MYFCLFSSEIAPMWLPCVQVFNPEEEVKTNITTEQTQHGRGCKLNTHQGVLFRDVAAGTSSQYVCGKYFAIFDSELVIYRSGCFSQVHTGFL